MNESILHGRPTATSTVLPSPPSRRRLLVGISGATGVVYAIRLLQLLREADVEIHLVVTTPYEVTRAYEADLCLKDLSRLADVSYSLAGVEEALANSSFTTMGMMVVPCSIRILTEIAGGATRTLFPRVADVVAGAVFR